MSPIKKSTSLKKPEPELTGSEVKLDKKNLDETEIKKGLKVIEIQNLVLKRILTEKNHDKDVVSGKDE